MAPEAALFNRAKDFAGGKASALAASTVSDPWYKDIVPNVRLQSTVSAHNTSTHATTSSKMFLNINYRLVMTMAILSHPSASTQQSIFPG